MPLRVVSVLVFGWHGAKTSFYMNPVLKCDLLFVFHDEPNLVDVGLRQLEANFT